MRKRKKPFTLKELLFAYLAVSKLMYWLNNIAALQQDDLGQVWLWVADRLLVQDIITIWILMVMFWLDHYVETHPAVRKGVLKQILVYGVGYVIYVGSIVGYFLFLGLFLPVQIGNWFEFLSVFSVFFAIAAAMLAIKDRMKKKEAEMYIPEEKKYGETSDLLDILCERGVLTQEECESKKQLPSKSSTD